MSVPEERCKRCWVTGRVQGVFFRATARERARALGLRGYARNLPDGRVEVLACGPEPALDEFCAWLWEGPPAARVEDVQCTAVEDPGVGEFDVA